MDVVYLFDAKRQVRRVLTSGVSELLHKEQDYLLTAEIPTDCHAMPGEYLGFTCVDSRFRLFEIDDAEDDDFKGITAISATDAAVSELATTVLVSLAAQDIQALDAVSRALSGTGWAIGTAQAGGRPGTVDLYYTSMWEALKTIADACNVRVLPYYLFDGGQLTVKKVDIQIREPVFRGRIFDSAEDASSVFLTHSGSPITVMYAIGKATGTTDNPERVTIADAVWSKSNGNPSDKPSGQLWVADAEALSKYGRKEAVFKDEQEEDSSKLLQKAWDELQKRKEPHVTGSAVVQDMEMVEGHEWQQIRLWDRVAVIRRNGSPFDAQVIGIQRDYVRPWLTKIELGDETQAEADIIRQLAGLQSQIGAVSGRVGGQGNKVDNTRVYLEAVAETTDGLNHLYIDLNANVGQMNLVAEQKYKDLDDARERISHAGITLDGPAASVQILASQSELDNIGERVTTAEATLTVQAGEISSKVSKNGVISSINQTAEAVKIQASKINLEGYVTASAMQTAIADVKITQSSTVACNTLETNSLIASYFMFGGNYVTKAAENYVTGVSFPKYVEDTIYYLDHNNKKQHARVLTPEKNSNGSVSREHSHTFLVV